MNKLNNQFCNACILYIFGINLKSHLVTVLANTVEYQNNCLDNLGSQTIYRLNI